MHSVHFNVFKFLQRKSIINIEFIEISHIIFSARMTFPHSSPPLVINHAS